MPQFDLRYIRAAEYSYNKETGAVSYGNKIAVGDAMAANLELKFAEGRLYAEGRLAEFMKTATGGTISLGVKYILQAAQKLLYGASDKIRTIGDTQITSLAFSSKDAPKYVGISFYAPDRIDGQAKYTCMFVSKALFGPPSYVYQTKGEKLTFQTPTTTGEFLADDTAGEVLIETAVVDTIDLAKAWCDSVFTSAAESTSDPELGEGAQ